MSRKKRNRLASGFGAVDAPNSSESTLEESEVEDMEEQDKPLYEDSTESMPCKHNCEFGCNDDECQLAEAKQDDAFVAPEPEVVLEQPMEEALAEPEMAAEPEPVMAAEPEPVMAHEVAHVEKPAPPAEAVKPAPVAAAPVVPAATPSAGTSTSQTASKFESILNEKSGAARRYFGNRTRY
jgi:outer membrane biosynthesis protein TonB